MAYLTYFDIHATSKAESEARHIHFKEVVMLFLLALVILTVGVAFITVGVMIDSPRPTILGIIITIVGIVMTVKLYEKSGYPGARLQTGKRYEMLACARTADSTFFFAKEESGRVLAYVSIGKNFCPPPRFTKLGDGALVPLTTAGTPNHESVFVP